MKINHSDQSRQEIRNIKQRNAWLFSQSINYFFLNFLNVNQSYSEISNDKRKRKEHPKNMPPNFCPYLRQILTNLQKF